MHACFMLGPSLLVRLTSCKTLQIQTCASNENTLFVLVDRIAKVVRRKKDVVTVYCKLDEATSATSGLRQQDNTPLVRLNVRMQHKALQRWAPFSCWALGFVSGLPLVLSSVRISVDAGRLESLCVFITVAQVCSASVAARLHLASGGGSREAGAEVQPHPPPRSPSFSLPGFIAAYRLISA